MPLFPVVNHWIHLISAVLWVGGLAFQVFVFFPVFQKNKLFSNDVTRAIANRFRIMVGPLIGLLIVTGGMNISSRRSAAKAVSPLCGTGDHPECIPAGYISALALKLLFVVAITSIYLFDVMVSRKQEEPKEAPADGVPAPIRISLILGMLVIFMAAMLRLWRF